MIFTNLTNDTDFKGQLTAAEVRLLPSILRKLSVETDGEGFRALAASLSHLEKLQHLGGSSSPVNVKGNSHSCIIYVGAKLAVAGMALSVLSRRERRRH